MQDDWKLTDRLTLNLGIRLEHEGRTTDRFDNGNSGLDFSAVSPLEAAVQANYAKSPIAELQSIKVRGGLGFLNVAGARRRYLNTPSDSRTALRIGLPGQQIHGLASRLGHLLLAEQRHELPADRLQQQHADATVHRQQFDPV